MIFTINQTIIQFFPLSAFATRGEARKTLTSSSVFPMSEGVQRRRHNQRCISHFPVVLGNFEEVNRSILYHVYTILYSSLQSFINCFGKLFDLTETMRMVFHVDDTCAELSWLAGLRTCRSLARERPGILNFELLNILKENLE